MTELFQEAFFDGLKDALWSLPVLFAAYLLMEWLEDSEKLNEGILEKYSHKAGPLLGGILGIIPQCGISGAAATLYATGSVSVGTMLAVFFSTSDEMLPILLSSIAERGTDLASVGQLVLIKAGAGIILGYAADLIFGKYFRNKKDIHSFCEREHCACDGEEEGSIFAAALKHTVKITVLLFAVNVVLNIVLGCTGISTLENSLLNRPFAGEALTALFGLIPNCSVSIVLTRSRLSGVLGLGPMFAGLLSNAGIGLLVLFRTNSDLRENLEITALLYFFSVIAGLAVTILL